MCTFSSDALVGYVVNQNADVVKGYIGVRKSCASYLLSIYINDFWSFWNCLPSHQMTFWSFLDVIKCKMASGAVRKASSEKAIRFIKQLCHWLYISLRIDSFFHLALYPVTNFKPSRQLRTQIRKKLRQDSSPLPSKLTSSKKTYHVW